MIETGEFKADPLSKLIRRMKRKIKTVDMVRDSNDDKLIQIYAYNSIGMMTIELHEDDHESINEWISLFDS